MHTQTINTKQGEKTWIDTSTKKTDGPQTHTIKPPNHVIVGK